MVIIQPDQGLFFPAIEYVEGRVFSMALAADKPKAVILDLSHISGVDYSSLHVCQDLLLQLACTP